MSALGLLRRALRIPPPQHRGVALELNYGYVYATPTTQLVQLSQLITDLVSGSCYLILKNGGPGTVYVCFKDALQNLSADGDAGGTVAGWPIFPGEAEHVEFTGFSRVNVYSPTEANFYIRVGS